MEQACFNGSTCVYNDLEGNLTSQLGELLIQFRISNSSALPNQSEVYNSTIHYYLLLDKNDTNATGELNSTNIQKDVITLLYSPQDKYANAIGIGSPCRVLQC